MNGEIILRFLGDLRDNNSREWMQSNKACYREASAAFEALVEELVAALLPEEPALAGLCPKNTVFRMNRDTRFSRDKAPYHTAFRAHISPGGRAPVPVGYYLHIMPRGCFLGGGLFASGWKEATAGIRDAIAEDGAAFDQIVKAKPFSEAFQLQGEMLKNVPRGYAPEHPFGEYLRHKSWFVEAPFPDEMLNRPEAFYGFALEKCAAMRPFHQYLNEALKGVTMPGR